MKLKKFQEDTVAAVLAGLGAGAYALADEVGLGKTLVCADVARRLIEKYPKRERFILYYVAPSIELLNQNLVSVARHLEAELKPEGAYKVHSIVSRISKVPLTLCNTEQGKKNVFLIGLSPATSFKITREGLKDERAYLAALFGINCQEQWKSSVNRFFWCLGRAVDPGFVGRVQDYTSYQALGALYHWRNEERDVYKEFTTRINALMSTARPDLKAMRKLVAEIRRSIAAFLVTSQQTLPDFVVFDEWHKYKTTCFESGLKAHRHERLVADLLAALRRSRKSKVLFVSATPFTVDYGDLQENVGIAASSDLKSLIQLFWDKERFEDEYEKLKQKQLAFVSAVGKLLKHEAGDNFQQLKKDAHRHCRQYEEELRRYCVRTERPRIGIGDPKDDNKLNWEQVFQSGSAKEFVRRFSKLKDVRSPVTAMWMDGHTFPQAGYAGLKTYDVKNLKKEHWKVQRLKTLLKSAFTFEDGLHSFERPPLWLRPETPLTGRKQLIFSEFRFVPEEICKVLQKSHFGVHKTARYSGSVLGFFPLTHNKDTRSIGEKNLKKSIHFPLFYPFLFWEMEQTALARKISEHRGEVDEIICNGEYAVPTLLQIENLLVHGVAELEKPMAARRSLMRENFGIKSSSRFREYLQAIVSGAMDGWAPGRIAALVVRQQRKRCLHSAMRPPHFEEKALQLGEVLFHLFVTPEAQVLKKVVKVPARAKLPRNWNSFLRFALWYANRNQLLATLQDFSLLLEKSGQDGLNVLSEIVASMSLKRGSVGTKFVRSFHDRKVDDAESEGENASVSTKSIRAAFNSPFPPYVLASTSVGQEGLDFHRYCDSIIHWTPPSSPSVLRQRQGRLDRFQSLQVRIAILKIGIGSGFSNDDTLGGLSPDFVVMHNNQRINEPNVEVFYLPFTAQHAAWRRCLQRMHYDDLLIGAPDPLADERMWLEAIDDYSIEERARRFAVLNEFSISLKPR